MLGSLIMAMSARAELCPVIEDMPAIVVFGREGNQTPRGSWFADTDRQFAKDGAALMGMQTLVLRSSALQELAHRVPKGRVFSSGKLFAPMIQASVFEQLVALVPKGKQVRKAKLQLVSSGEPGKPAGATSDSMGSAATDKPSNETRKPTDWGDIVSGSLVLALDSVEECWYEAISTMRSDHHSSVGR